MEGVINLGSLRKKRIARLVMIRLNISDCGYSYYVQLWSVNVHMPLLGAAVKIVGWWVVGQTKLEVVVALWLSWHCEKRAI